MDVILYTKFQHAHPRIHLFQRRQYLTIIIILLGKCFYKVILESFPTKMDALRNALLLGGGQHQPPLPPLNFHFAPIFGCLCGRLGITLPILERMYMRMLLRDLISAATRLSVLGPLEGSRLQAHYAGAHLCMYVYAWMDYCIHTYMVHLCVCTNYMHCLLMECMYVIISTIITICQSLCVFMCAPTVCMYVPCFMAYGMEQ